MVCVPVTLHVHARTIIKAVVSSPHKAHSSLLGTHYTCKINNLDRVIDHTKIKLSFGSKSKKTFLIRVKSFDVFLPVVYTVQRLHAKYVGCGSAPQTHTCLTCASDPSILIVGTVMDSNPIMSTLQQLTLFASAIHLIQENTSRYLTVHQIGRLQSFSTWQKRFILDTIHIDSNKSSHFNIERFNIICYLCISFK